MQKEVKNTIKRLIFVVCALFVAQSSYLLLNMNGEQESVSAEPLPPPQVQIKKADNTLRVLVWKGADLPLPRSGAALNLELHYLSMFAEEQKLTIEEIKVDKFSDLIPFLLAGKGDLIAANLTITEARKQKIKFTESFFQTKEYFISGKNAKSLKNGVHLNKRTVHIQKGKSYDLTAQALKKIHPRLEIKYIDDKLSFDQIYSKLASGEFDLTIQDQNLINIAQTYRNDITKSIQASGTRHLAWGVAPDNKVLLKKLNAFLKKEKLIKNSFTKSKKKKGESQWQHIKNTKTIRFVLRNNLASYYIWRGELLGFHYELAKRFAKEYRLSYEIIVAPNNASLLNYVLNDKADIALGFLTPTQERRDMGLLFSRPYHYASELVVANSSHPEISSIEELNDADIYLRRTSAYWQSALEIKKLVKSLNMHQVSDQEETEHIIDSVGRGKYSMTISDGHILDLEMTFRDDIQSLIALGEPKAQSWAVKKGNERLLKNVDHFIKKYYKGLFYNVIYNKYFKNERRIGKQYKDYVHQNNTGELSPYDDTVKFYAKKYDFDWRLLVAQMHQESRFNPNAVSMAGAQGLFQVMPRTARELGIKNMHDPKQGIKAGISYMNWVRERMQINFVDKNELIWFTLASYNAGAGHVRDAMALAKKKGWKEDVWIDNVERAMLLLSEPKYAAKARYGYVRGREPVIYVRAIKLRYETYVNIENAISHIEH